jgi:hypothetical protein
MGAPKDHPNLPLRAGARAESAPVVSLRPRAYQHLAKTLLLTELMRGL